MSTWTGDRGLTAPGSARLAVIIRTGLVGIILLRLVLRNWWLLATTPPPLYGEVFAVSWMAGPPSRTMVSVLWIIGVIAAIACVARVRAQLTFVIAWVALMLLCAMWSSSGKIMHNDILLLWACVPFLFAAAPRGPQLDEMSERWGWAPRSSMVIVAAVYFLTGVQKLRHSGFAWISADNTGWVIRQGNGPLGNDLNHDIAAWGWLMFALAAATIVFEVGAPAFLAFARTRAVFVVVMGSFHLSIFLTLGLDYYGWILTLVVVILAQATIPEFLTHPMRRFIPDQWLPPAWKRPSAAPTAGQ